MFVQYAKDMGENKLTRTSWQFMPQILSKFPQKKKNEENTVLHGRTHTYILTKKTANSTNRGTEAKPKAHNLECHLVVIWDQWKGSKHLSITLVMFSGTRGERIHLASFSWSLKPISKYSSNYLASFFKVVCQEIWIDRIKHTVRRTFDARNNRVKRSCNVRTRPRELRDQMRRSRNNVGRRQHRAFFLSRIHGGTTISNRVLNGDTGGQRVWQEITAGDDVGKGTGSRVRGGKRWNRSGSGRGRHRTIGGVVAVQLISHLFYPRR